MIDVTYNPVKGQRIEYIYYSHPKPWKSNLGEVLDCSIIDSEIRVKVKLSRKEAEKDYFWDPWNQSVFVDIIDADGKVVFEARVPVKKDTIEFDMGLRE